MNNSLLFIFISFFLLGCQKSVNYSDLPVIDISKKYPQKEIHLQDIADMEYIPLETTDDVLLGQFPWLSYLSDNYILVWNMGHEDIFVFNRNGKIVSHFKHKGQGDKEYVGITAGTGVILDEKNEEIFVFSQFRILVYSLTGAYKRTLKYPTDLTLTTANNLDDETLLVYDNYSFSYYRDTIINKPYKLLSKKDGSIVSELDIRLPVRYSNRTAQVIDQGRRQENIIYIPLSIPIPKNMCYGQEFVISDISSDTIYLLTQNRELTPMLVRKPSVHSSEPRIVWSTIFTTDKFMILQKSIIDFIAAEKGRPVSDVFMMYEFETGEISEVSFIDNDLVRDWMPILSISAPKNVYAHLISTPRLKAAYEAKQLKGDLEKLVETLDEDDNGVLRIISFR